MMCQNAECNPIVTPKVFHSCVALGDTHKEQMGISPVLSHSAAQALGCSAVVIPVALSYQ